MYFLFSIILLIDIFDENLKKSLTNYISFNSSEIFKQAFKIIIIYSLLTLLIFIILRFVNLRTFNALNLSLTIISSGGFLSTNNLENLFQSDVSKIILSTLMLLSYFSLFLIYNIFFYKKKKINYLSEDIYLLIYLLVIISIIFVFFNNNNNFLNLLVSISSSVSNIGISFNDTASNLSFVFLILVIIGGSFFSTSSGLRFIKVISLIKFSLNNLLSHAKPNQIFSVSDIVYQEQSVPEANPDQQQSPAETVQSPNLNLCSAAHTHSQDHSVCLHQVPEALYSLDRWRSNLQDVPDCAILVPNYGGFSLFWIPILFYSLFLNPLSNQYPHTTEQNSHISLK